MNTITLIEVLTIGIFVISVLHLMLTYHAFYVKSGYETVKKALGVLPGLS